MCPGGRPAQGHTPHLHILANRMHIGSVKPMQSAQFQSQYHTKLRGSIILDLGPRTTQPVTQALDKIGIFTTIPLLLLSSHHTRLFSFPTPCIVASGEFIFTDVTAAYDFSHQPCFSDVNMGASTLAQSFSGSASWQDLMPDGILMLSNVVRRVLRHCSYFRYMIEAAVRSWLFDQVQARSSEG